MSKTKDVQYVYYVGDDDGGIVGIFDSKEKAEAACKTETDYILALKLNQALTGEARFIKESEQEYPLYQEAEAKRQLEACNKMLKADYGVTQYQFKLEPVAC